MNMQHESYLRSRKENIKEIKKDTYAFKIIDIIKNNCLSKEEILYKILYKDKDKLNDIDIKNTDISPFTYYSSHYKTDPQHGHIERMLDIMCKSSIIKKIENKGYILFLNESNAKILKKSKKIYLHMRNKYYIRKYITYLQNNLISLIILLITALGLIFSILAYLRPNVINIIFQT